MSDHSPPASPSPLAGTGSAQQGPLQRFSTPPPRTCTPSAEPQQSGSGSAQPSLAEPHPTPVKPTPSTINQHAYDPPKGKQIGLSLITPTGMGSRFHQLPTATFLGLLPGPSPSAEERKSFKSCSLKKVKRESQIYPKIVRGILLSLSDMC